MSKVFRKSADELDKYPTTLWDRYAVAIGDLEDYDTAKILEEA